MAAVDIDATATPRDLVTVAGLAVGTTYSGQNLSTTATLFIRGAATAPDAGERAFRVEAGGAFTITAEAGAGIFVWTDDAAGCPLILDRAA